MMRVSERLRKYLSGIEEAKIGIIRARSIEVEPFEERMRVLETEKAKVEETYEPNLRELDQKKLEASKQLEAAVAKENTQDARKDLNKFIGPKTAELLALCKKAKYGIIGICRGDKKIKACKNWPFDYSGSIFAHPDRKTKPDNVWPAIWKITEKLEVGGGCGNHQQHSLRGDHGLRPGVYTLKKGKWTWKEGLK